MYVECPDGFVKIIGQIAEFRRSGSALVSHATAGIKTQKENIQLLGAHAQTSVSAQPGFYFVPAKQEADTGVNGGDLILIRLEEKSERRQFEIAAHGLWRTSSGISLTHQVQLLRSEVKPNVYRIAPATPLTKGEYALYLSRGEGMASYVYDFGVQEGTALTTSGKGGASSTGNASDPPPNSSDITPKNLANVPSQQSFKDATIGAFADGNPDVRRDGIELSAVTAGGPADQVGIKAGDVIVSINDHYVYTIRELNEEITRYEPGTKIGVRYRRYSTSNNTFVVVGRANN